MDPVFTDAEKRFVLAEMIKVSHMDVGTLVEFVKFHEISPDWFEMQLPGGRNIRQCLRAAEMMFNMHLQPPTVPTLKRKSFGDVTEQLPKRHAIQSPAESQPYSASRSFGSHPVGHGQHQLPPQSQLQIPPHLQHQPPPPSLPQLQPHPQPLQPQPVAQPVNIQPRPAPNLNGLAASPSTSSPRGTASTPTGTGRKRGRPSKADREAWARANATQQTSYAPITPAPIAPQPGPTGTPSTYSPSPVVPPAYQISTTAPPSDSQLKSEPGRPSADLHLRSQYVPRSIQPTVSPDARDRDTSDHQSKSEKEDEWREGAAQTGQSALGRYPSPTRAGPPVADRSSGSPYAVGALREAVGPTMEHARNEGQPTVANRA